MARYRSTVPLGSAPDANEPVRVRYQSLTLAVQYLAMSVGIMDGATMAEARRAVEQHMKRLNDDQRRKLLLKLGVLLR